MKRDYHKIKLDAGAHQPGATLCVMEAVAYFAGEPHTDEPECACPVITKFAQSLNDNCSDDQRERLKPFVPLIAGTRDGREKERAEVFAMAAVTEFLPFVLDAVGLTDIAARCREAKTLHFANGAAAAARDARPTDVNFYTARAAQVTACACDAYIATIYAMKPAAAIYAANFAADAYTAADAADSDTVFNLALSALDRAIRIGRPDISQLLAEIEEAKKHQPDENEFGLVAVREAKRVFVEKEMGER